MFKLDTYLQSFKNWEPQLGVLGQTGVSAFSTERVEKLLTAFGRPDDKIKFAHVAGTKGKGSTAVFLAYILRAAGYRVGLYTSPHLYHVRERIRFLEPGVASDDIFEGSISEEEMKERARYYEEPVEEFRQGEGAGITYFEYITALAISWFAYKKADVVVLETGLGGTWDATNIFETSVCGITPIGFDHTAILGKSLGLIAAEKAGIIRSVNQRVALAPQQPEAMAVLQARCKEFGIRPTVVGKEMPVVIRASSLDGVIFDVSGRRAYEGLLTSLLGEHQAYNAATAIAMAEDIETFGFLIDEQCVRRGVNDARWPVRFEVIARAPFVILDSAHTVESAQACVSAFKALFPGKKYVLLFGISADKDIPAVARELGAEASSVVVTQADHPRAAVLTAKEASALFPSVEVKNIINAKEAFDHARSIAGPQGVVLAAGSVFLAGQVRRYVSI